MLIAMTACGGTPGSPRAPTTSGPVELHPAELCVTKGEVVGHAIREPTVRAFGLGTAGDAAQLAFTFGGNADTMRALSSGENRRQLGIKLRAQDSCNVVYVMWRLDPKPFLEVSVKHNPGMRTHEECGASGYSKIKPAFVAPVPPLEIGSRHVLRAAIGGDELVAWIDDTVVWRGLLPASAREIVGPAGLRSDNVKLDLLELAAPRAGANPACKRHERDD